MEQFEFKRISPFNWGNTGRGIIAIVILCIYNGMFGSSGN